MRLLGISDCGNIDDVDVTVKADGATISSFELEGSCVFSVTIPSDADHLEIYINGDDDGVTINGTAHWYGLQSVTDDTPWPVTTVERTGGKEVPVPAEMCNIFWWEWSAFYDGREDHLKDVLNVDIAQLATWVGANPGAREAQVVFLEIVPATSFSSFPVDARRLMLDGSVDPAMRLLNGQTLPNKMSLASEWPLYVDGDFNRVNKRPAALVGDAITILSNAWDDADNRPGQTIFDNCGPASANNPCADYVTWADGWSKKDASETTIFGAILAGHSPTPCDHEDSDCFADGTSASCYTDCYGGGIENFPRFLERWSGIWFHYTGALISPWWNQKTDGTWNGGYYSPPKRDWAFDTDFRNPELLPPGTPNVGMVLRTAMREAF